MTETTQFDVRRLPRLPDEILKHFRHELPAEVAEESAPVGTRALWETQEDGYTPDIITESVNEGVNWDRVDERTMTKSILNKRSRGPRSSLPGAGSSSTAASRHEAMVRLPSAAQKQAALVLMHPDGKREFVDFRAVATLKSFLSETGKIIPRRKCHLSLKSQRRLSRAVKTARIMALLHPEPKTSLSFEEMRAIEREMQEAET